MPGPELIPKTLLLCLHLNFVHDNYSFFETILGFLYVKGVISTIVKSSVPAHLRRLHIKDTENFICHRLSPVCSFSFSLLTYGQCTQLRYQL